MKRLKYLLCILAVALLTIISALAAEGEEPLQTGQIETQVLPQVKRSNAQMLDISGTSSIQDNTLYQEIYEMLMDKQQYLDIEKYGFAINGDGPDQLLYYITAVLYDHPEIYYAKTGFSYSYNPSTGRITKITPMYIEEVMTDAAQEEINQAIAEAMVQADHPGLSDVEKALLLHDYLVNHVTYNWDIAVASTKEEMNAATEKAGPLVYTAYGAFVNGDAVCQGYALAYKLLLDKCGIDSTLVSSEAMNHVWNLVKIDNNWYHVDVTWDDPTPNVHGGGQHGNFLRSDAGITEKNHYEWEDKGITCSSEYITDWWLNDVWFPVYYWQDSYYYIKMGGSTFDYRIYTTNSLSSAGTNVSQNYLDYSVSSQNGVLWLDGQLYYTRKGNGDNRILYCFDLTQKTAVELLEIPFTKTANDKYQADKDGVGLRYDPDTRMIYTSSNTRPTMTGMPNYQLKDYPLDWDQVSKETTALAGARWKDESTLQIGVVYVSSDDKPTLWAATYHNGRMTGVNQVDTSELTNGLNILELSVPSGEGFDTRLFLLSKNSCIPVGNMVTVP